MLYDYDVFDRRVSRTVGFDGAEGNATATEKYVYDGDSASGLNSIVLDFVRPEGSASFGLEHRYLHGNAVDQVFAQEDPTLDFVALGRVTWFAADNQGTTRNLLQRDGQTLAHFKYDAFGNPQQPAAVNLTRYLYTGREFDITTGLQYNRERWYDPRTGRWLSEDPIGFAAGDANLYRYVGNGPTNATDPSGLDFIALGDRRVGGSFGAAYHYSLEYWVSKCPAPQATPQGIAPGAIPGLSHDPTARKTKGVELLASTGWTAKFLATGTFSPVNYTVSIAYISKTSMATKLVPLKDGATAADWANVIGFADAYGYAEHPPGNTLTGPLRNWPYSYYVALGTNSNVFIRWLVGASGMSMVEMTGNHPPDPSRQPQQNGPAGGVLLTNPLPT